MATTLRTTVYRDGTVRYWSVYRQVWIRCAASSISDETLATMTDAERARIARAVHEARR